MSSAMPMAGCASLMWIATCTKPHRTRRGPPGIPGCHSTYPRLQWATLVHGPMQEPTSFHSHFQRQAQGLGIPEPAFGTESDRTYQIVEHVQLCIACLEPASGTNLVAKLVEV